MMGDMLLQVRNWLRQGPVVLSGFLRKKGFLSTQAFSTLLFSDSILVYSLPGENAIHAFIVKETPGFLTSIDNSVRAGSPA